MFESKIDDLRSTDFSSKVDSIIELAAQRFFHCLRHRETQRVSIGPKIREILRQIDPAINPAMQHADIAVPERQCERTASCVRMDRR
ncbi:hypothetical protein GCM10007989_11480 [Devosia pacifica]|uniref:Uncharacterized protein n=1 Tax=Devosia pacifica TaxID=1335967 RepID=A0A918RZ99_9HYPH|nr:hypothetical protein GCM10007989_11480 [Devosia pacifica]